MNQVEAVLALTKIEHDTLACVGNFFQRAAKLITGVIDRRAEHVARDVLAVHAHHHRIARAHVAHHHREMHVAINRVLERDGAELSIDSRQISFDGAAYQDFFGNSITDEIGNANDLQSVDAGELAQLRQARHRAVFIHDFANHAGGIKPRDARDVHRGFGLAGTHQDAAFLCSQRKDVTRASEILRFRPRIDCGQNRGRAIGRRNSGGHAAPRFDRDCERSAETRSVVGDWRRQMQFIATRFHQRQTNQATRMPHHEIDYFRCDFFRGANQIAFVLAIFVIDNDDHSSLTNVGSGVRNGSEWHVWNLES